MREAAAEQSKRYNPTLINEALCTALSILKKARDAKCDRSAVTHSSVEAVPAKKKMRMVVKPTVASVAVADENHESHVVDHLNSDARDGCAPVGTDDSPVFSLRESSPGRRTGEIVGNGACTAVALTSLKVFDNKSDAIKALDARILVFMLTIRPDFRTPEHVGVAGDRWHQDIVKQAVVSMGYHFHKLDLNIVSLKDALKSGTYLVDGVMNNSHLRRGHHGKMYWIEQDPADSSDPRTEEMKWRHSIAVRDGRVLDPNYGTDMSVRYLWLDANNEPDRDKGYMLKLLKVYRIFKCKTGDAKCRGECCGEVSAQKKP